MTERREPLRSAGVNLCGTRTRAVGHEKAAHVGWAAGEALKAWFADVMARLWQSLPARGARLALFDLLLAREDLASDLERGFVVDGDRLIKHARYWSILAENHLTRHQGLGNRLIMPDECHAAHRGAVLRRERLGGTLNYYYRSAA